MVEQSIPARFAPMQQTKVAGIVYTDRRKIASRTQVRIKKQKVHSPQRHPTYCHQSIDNPFCGGETQLHGKCHCPLSLVAVHAKNIFAYLINQHVHK